MNHSKCKAEVVNEKLPQTVADIYKMIRIFHRDIPNRMIFDSDDLNLTLSTSDDLLVAINVRYPMTTQFLVPTDNFWRVFGFEDGTDVIKDVKEKYQCQDDPLSEDQVEKLNIDLLRLVN